MFLVCCDGATVSQSSDGQEQLLFVITLLLALHVVVEAEYKGGRVEGGVRSGVFLVLVYEVSGLHWLSRKPQPRFRFFTESVHRNNSFSWS